MWTNIKSGIARLFERAAKAAKALWMDREGRGRVAWYGALALLLVMLGMASRAYRAHRPMAEEAPEEPPVAALSVQTPTFAPELSATPAPEIWVWPLEGEIVGAYSPDAPVWSETLGQWQTHPALDIAGAPGEAVYACRDGTVVDAWQDRLWGNRIVIDHGEGYRSTYSGLNTLRMVEPGQTVKAGQVIGAVGQSATCESELGWHLHFELTKDGAPADLQALAKDSGEEG